MSLLKFCLYLSVCLGFIIQSKRPKGTTGKRRPSSGKNRLKKKSDSDTSYRIAITTGKKRDAGTDAQVKYRSNLLFFKKY